MATLGQVIEKARTFARCSTSGIDNNKAMGFVNEAMIQFVKDIPRLSKRKYLQVSPRFSLSNTLAVRLTIEGGANALVATDIPITDSAAELTGQTGTLAAAELQERIRAAIGVGATLTVTWSTSLWTFAIAAAGATLITLEAPTNLAYGDGSQVFGISGSVSAASFTGNIPEDCTLETTLPSDFLTLLEHPTWDEKILRNVPYRDIQAPEASGIPTDYSIEDKTIRLYPSPNKQGRLRIRYKYIPVSFVTVQGYQECGLAGRTLITATGLANTTVYHFQVRTDVGALVDYNFTTGTDTTFAAVIALLNLAYTLGTWSLVGGDFRCTSNTQSNLSAIGLAAGATGNNLFAALTGFIAFDAAVLNQMDDEVPIEDEWEVAIKAYVAYEMAGPFEASVASFCFAEYQREVSALRIQIANNDSRISGYEDPARIPNWEFVRQ